MSTCPFWELSCQKQLFHVSTHISVSLLLDLFKQAVGLCSNGESLEGMVRWEEPRCLGHQEEAAKQQRPAGVRGSADTQRGPGSKKSLTIIATQIWTSGSNTLSSPSQTVKLVEILQHIMCNSSLGIWKKKGKLFSDIKDIFSFSFLVF